MKRLACLLVLAATAAQAESDEALVSRYLKYRSLVRLTEQQIDLSRSVQMMCADPRPATGPHAWPGIHLYASQAAIWERQNKPASHHYPLGTLLVKEKFEKKGGDKPGIITVMEKITDKGTVEDWEFYMIRIADRKIVRDGFRASCVECYSRYTKSDFVSQETDSLVSAFASKR